MEGFSHLVCATTARDHSPHKGLLPAVASRQQRSRQLVARSPVVPNTYAWWMGTKVPSGRQRVASWHPAGTQQAVPSGHPVGTQLVPSSTQWSPGTQPGLKFEVQASRYIPCAVLEHMVVVWNA